MALLRGCVQRVFFSGVNAATAAVLAAEGWDVEAPQEPRCCGALQLHSGMGTDATANAQGDDRGARGLRPIVANAAGCGSAMKDYGHVLRDDPEWAERAAAFAAKVRDVTEILAEGEPRAQRHPIADEGGLPRRLPPGPRPGACARSRASCCAASPASSWSSPPSGRSAAARRASTTWSSPSRRPSWAGARPQNLLDTGAEAVVAANPGCALQIAAHTRELGQELAVIHPVELLARSLERRTS